MDTSLQHVWFWGGDSMVFLNFFFFFLSHKD